MKAIDLSTSPMAATPAASPIAEGSGTVADVVPGRWGRLTAVGGAPGTRLGRPPTGAVAAELRRRVGPPVDGPAGAAGPDPVGRDEAATVLARALRVGIGFKRQDEVFAARARPEELRDALLVDLAEAGRPVQDLLAEFELTVLPWCKNEASPRFLGFADTGDDLAAVAGELLSVLTQQNLINQSFDSPSATFVEIAVLRWLRELLGLPNRPAREVRSVWDVGGLVTPGGTMSNTVAMMLARERAAPGTMQAGVSDPGRFGIVVPAGVGHYSVKSALTWIGVGAQLIEVATCGYRYDLRQLQAAVRVNAGRVMAVVAYAGDSRTQTVEDLAAVRDVVRGQDERIWLHADACWGLVCAFTERLRPLIAGIEGYDSITVDPHKVMAVPYSLSALLVRDPQVLRTVSSYSDLIMQEDYAFGQVTPFVGSKPWLSLKLWMMMRTRGREGLRAMVEQRLDLRDRFVELLDSRPDLLRLHDPDLAAVVFCYFPGAGSTGRGAPLAEETVARINEVNSRIHADLLTAGDWHLHQFTLPDDTGRLRRGATVRPLRFMAGNPRTTDADLHGVLAAVVELGARHWAATA